VNGLNYLDDTAPHDDDAGELALVAARDRFTDLRIIEVLGRQAQRRATPAAGIPVPVPPVPWPPRGGAHVMWALLLGVVIFAFGVFTGFCLSGLPAERSE
jgi:hypothetical protein